MKLRPLSGKVFVRDIQKGERMIGSIVLLNDDGKNEGVRSRWAEVYSIANDVNHLNVGDYVLLKHGRWTRGIKVEDEDGDDLTVYMVDFPEAVLLVADAIPEDWETTFAVDAIKAEHKQREGELTESERKLNISEI